MKWEFGRASDDEGLRLVLAFFKVGDPRQRKLIIDLAETFAEASQAHLPLLEHDEVRRLVQDNARHGPNGA
jgi:hypothetical protein